MWFDQEKLHIKYIDFDMQKCSVNLTTPILKLLCQSNFVYMAHIYIHIYVWLMLSLTVKQTCQASHIWRESPTFYMYLIFTHKFPYIFYKFTLFFQLVTIHVFKIAAVAAQIHTFYLLELGSSGEIILA